jgi:protein-S-isoprenylcysteine O-methyltransferase Ste14
MSEIMGSVLHDSYETFAEHLNLILVFSIPFIIAFAIPLLAPLPTFVSLGGIFLRTASIFANLGFAGLAVIIVSFFFSLLFISFAFVAISLVVKAKRTHSKVSRRTIQGIEKYIGKVFLLFLLYAILISVAGIVGYYIGAEALLVGIIGFFGFIPFFYAPSAIVVDEQRTWRALVNSVRLVVREPQYFLMWFILITIILSILSVVFIALTGTVWARYIILILSSLFVLPYFVVFQAEAYMKRFAILRH